jgi:hypothetical protein
MNKPTFLFNNYHTTLRLFLSHKLLTTTSYFICNNILYFKLKNKLPSTFISCTISPFSSNSTFTIQKTVFYSQPAFWWCFRKITLVTRIFHCFSPLKKSKQKSSITTVKYFQFSHYYSRNSEEVHYQCTKH